MLCSFAYLALVLSAGTQQVNQCFKITWVHLDVGVQLC